jgi:hypothetical protein
VAKGAKANFNFVKKHGAHGKTPATVAGLTDKWWFLNPFCHLVLKAAETGTIEKLLDETTRAA